MRGMYTMLHHHRLCRGWEHFLMAKLSLSPDVGGNLPEILGYEQAEELITGG